MFYSAQICYTSLYLHFCSNYSNYIKCNGNFQRFNDHNRGQGVVEQWWVGDGEGGVCYRRWKTLLNTASLIVFIETLASLDAKFPLSDHLVKQRYWLEDWILGHLIHNLHHKSVGVEAGVVR